MAAYRRLFFSFATLIPRFASRGNRAAVQSTFWDSFRPQKKSQNRPSHRGCNLCSRSLGGEHMFSPTALTLYRPSLYLFFWTPKFRIGIRSQPVIFSLPTPPRRPRAGCSSVTYWYTFGHQKKYPADYQIEVAFCAVETRGNTCFPLQHCRVPPVWCFSRVKIPRGSIGKLSSTDDFLRQSTLKLAVKV